MSMLVNIRGGIRRGLRFIADNWPDILFFSLVGGAILGVLYFAGTHSDSKPEAAKPAQAENKPAEVEKEAKPVKPGLILVEYDYSYDKQSGNVDGHAAVKCIIEANDQTYNTTMTHRSIPLPNRFDDNDIDHMAKVLNYDQEKQGKCYRFHYDGDPSK
jgi:hypothetical protein